MLKNILCCLVLTFVTAVSAKTIVIVGDSLSAGYGLVENSGWASQLKKRLPAEYTLINISTSGDTTSNGLTKLPEALRTYQPSVVVIELGANDGLRGLPTAVMKKNLQTMISQSLHYTPKILLLATLLPPNYGQLYLQKFNQVYQDLAKQNNIALVPMFLDKVAGHANLMQADGLHPNQAAQSIILDTVWQSLKPLL